MGGTSVLTPVGVAAAVRRPRRTDPARTLDPDHLAQNAQLGGTVQLSEWIGDGATTFGD